MLLKKLRSFFQRFDRDFFLGTDMHAHFLPGLDDGPKTMSATMEMIQAFAAAGFKHLTATPHVFSEYYPNTKHEILERFWEVQQELDKHQDIDIRLNIAAEYYLDDHFQYLLAQKELLIYPNQSLLVECSMLGSTPNLAEYLFNIQLQGYQPILAHPERYLYMQDTDYQKLIEQGCIFQVNLLSLAGHYGWRVKRRAKKIIQKYPVRYLGTDAHNVAQVDKVAQFLQSSKANKLLYNKTLFNEQMIFTNSRQKSYYA